MGKIRFAFATDDGERLIDRHFGDAKQYALFEIDETGSVFSGTVTNSVDEEGPDAHADPAKAGGIAALLRKEGVEGTAARVFGPNLARIKKKFVCVILEGPLIQDAVALTVAHFASIRAELARGEERAHIDLRRQ